MQDAVLLAREVDENRMANLWVPLVDAPLETGPLRVIPSSHRWGCLPYYPSESQIGVAATAFAQAVAGGRQERRAAWPDVSPQQLSDATVDRYDAYVGERMREADLDPSTLGCELAPGLEIAEGVGGEDWHAVDCPLPLGSALLIHERLVHASTPNASDVCRWSLDIRYCNALLPTGRPVPGFVARSPSRPEVVARSHMDWLRLFPEELAVYEQREAARL